MSSILTEVQNETRPFADGAAAPVDLRFVEETITRVGPAPEGVIPILQAIQEYYGYLPKEALEEVTRKTRISPATIVGVSSFYDMFRHRPTGKTIVRVCRGTACHVTGATRVEEALRRELRIPANDDTDPERKYTIEPVACLGCCTLAPVVKIDQNTFGHTTAEKLPALVREFLRRPRSEATIPVEPRARITKPEQAEIHIGLGSCCMAKGSDELFLALQQSVRATGADVTVKPVGCVGMCHRTPMIEVAIPGKPSVFYAGLRPDQAPRLVRRHFAPRGLLPKVSRFWTRTLDVMLTGGQSQHVDERLMRREEASVEAFLGRQVHLATEHFGRMDPLHLEEYIEAGGFGALRRCLATHNQEHPEALAAEALIGMIEKSGLRGRGGAGYPTGQKWRLARSQPGETKYVICNGDEGDPGAFMDRMLLESFPYRIIEGLAIAAVAVGAHEGVFYIRHEYPLAVQRVRAAIKLLQQRGWLGEKLLGSDYALRLTIQEGAGAFVCGEETALIASIEGRRGMPRLRPPFPVEQGLWGKPTIINNVETLALVPWIVRHGAEAFAAYGTKGSKGTKVFALAGNVRRGGLIEVPMGTTIREIVEEIGGGVPEGRKFKGVQIGGPSGGCVPARLADTPVDYESLRDVGAIMGSGGLVVLDDRACMVDIARYFLQFTQNQSCGKCSFCRIGTRRMLDILERLCAGKSQRQDLAELERLGAQVGAGSLCGLGKTAPNPVLTTLRYFRDEYEAHLQGRCPAGKCSALIHYRVRESCTGCTLCAQHCPANAIPMTPYARHTIDDAKCTRCDSCRQVCPYDSISLS